MVSVARITIHIEIDLEERLHSMSLRRIKGKYREKYDHLEATIKETLSSPALSIRFLQNTLNPQSFKPFPRIGAFEVELYWPDQSHNVFSKLETQRWPNIHSLVSRIDKIISQQNTVKFSPTQNQSSPANKSFAKSTPTSVFRRSLENVSYASPSLY